MSVSWWKNPLRIIRYDPLNDFTSFMNGDYAEHAREVRHVCHANCEWVMANGGSSPGTASTVNFDSPHFDKNETVGDRDILRDYVPYAHNEGIRVIAYINLHWFSYVFADAHPGWEQLLSSGEPYGRKNPLYGNGTTMCVNTGWRDWAYLMIREAMTTGIDGVFLDGPVVFPGSCYCPECRRLYSEANNGCEPPVEEDWSSDWVSWVEFRERSMERFLRDAKQSVLEVNPDGIVYLNAGGYQLSTRTARNPWRLESSQHMTGAEVFVHFGVPHEDILDTTIMGKFLSAGKNPAIVFSDHATGGWHYVGLREAELCREFYQTAAAGASPWIAVFTPALEHQREKTLKPVGAGWKKLESLEPFLTCDKPAARVAVLRSDATALSYRSRVEALKQKSSGAREQDLIASVETESMENVVAHKRFCEELTVEEFRGWCELLTRAHIPFSVWRDCDCTSDRLSRFDCVVLPDAACMSDDQLAALEGFIDDGGTVISTFETGWYDESGVLRDVGAGGNGVPVPESTTAFPPANFEEYAIFQRTEDDDTYNALITGFDDGQLIPRPEYVLQVQTPERAATPAFCLEPIGYHYRKPCGVSSHPLIVAGMRGDGRWVYLPCLIGRDWRTYRVPAWEDLVSSIVRGVIGAKIQLLTDAPTTVQIEVRKQVPAEDQGERILLHIINNTGNNQFPISEILPVGAISISMLLGKPRRLYIANGEDIPYTYADGRIDFQIPVNEQYQIIAIEVE